jgi:hypothetical protein
VLFPSASIVIQQQLMMMTIVQPTDYRTFCFRGEGRANFVISAKCFETGKRLVKHVSVGNYQKYQILELFGVLQKIEKPVLLMLILAIN